jgi:hypothetical protein
LDVRYGLGAYLAVCPGRGQHRRCALASAQSALAVRADESRARPRRMPPPSGGPGGSRAGLRLEPRIHIVSRPGREDDVAEVERLNDGQWHAWDMLLGRREPELGGAEDVLDVVGVNFDWSNRWLHHGSYGQRPPPYDERWRLPLRHLLADVHGRYRRPLFVAETSGEGVRRTTWFRYAAEEVREALRAGLRRSKASATARCSGTSAGTTNATAPTACPRRRRTTAGGRCTRRWRGSAPAAGGVRGAGGGRRGGAAAVA